MLPIITIITAIPSPLLSAVILRGFTTAEINTVIQRITAGVITSNEEAIGDKPYTSGVDEDTFEGVALEAGDHLLKPTLKGDCDLNGVVDADDLSAFSDGFRGISLPCWSSGDFNRNGIVDANDRAAQATNYQG